MKKIYYFLLFFFLFGLFLFLFKTKAQNKEIYHYKIKRESNYNAILKPNNFYDTNVLPSGSYYTSKALSSYLITFHYTFQGNKKENLYYSYDIDLDLVGSIENENGQEKEIWIKNFIIQEKKQFSLKQSNSFSIQENVTIDYPFYNQLARSFENTYGITIHSILKAKLNLSYYVEQNGKKIEEKKDTVELDISLTNTTSKVKENYKKGFDKSITNKKENDLAIYIIFIILFLILFFFHLLLFRRPKTKEEKYQKKKKQILKDSSDYLISVLNKPNLFNLSKLKVKSLNDLVEIAEQNMVSLIHYEDIEAKEDYFYVIVGNYVYYYILTMEKE